MTLETKARVQRLAQRDGITESALSKQLLDVVLRSSSPDEPALASADKVNRQGRVYLRMEPQDLRLLQARSEARGMASATYAALALRSAPLPKAEYVALRQAIDQLAALGRNLNQIARVLNQGGGPALPGRQEVAAMLKVAETLRDHFRALLDANQRSWEDGRANTTH